LNVEQATEENATQAPVGVKYILSIKYPMYDI